MTISIWQSEWLIWCIMAFVPFKVYDLYKKKDRKWNDFVVPCFMTLLMLMYVSERISGNYEPHSIPVLGGMQTIYVLGGIAYLSSLYEAVTERTKREYIYTGQIGRAHV